MSDISFVKDKFKEWYLSRWKPWVPDLARWHHFRFRTFNGEWITPVDKRIRNAHILQKNVFHPRVFPPRDIFYSVLRWLDPKALGTSGVRNYCLGGPLVFDIDVKLPKNLPLDESLLNEAKYQAVQLMEKFRDEFSLTDFKCVFTGRKGFHVYIYDYETLFLEEWNCSLEMREEFEKRKRKEIVLFLQNHGIKFDYNVTLDTKRIIRLPGTLHGETGLLCKHIGKTEKDIERFKISEAIAFEEGITVKVRFLKEIRSFVLEETYGPFSKSEETKIPVFVALPLILQEMATLCK